MEHQNILKSQIFQEPLPLLHRVTPLLHRSLTTTPGGEEAQQSLRLKKNALFQALEAKRNGNNKEFYEVINRQSFMNVQKEDPKGIRLWVKVFLESLSKIIHEYNDSELLELIVFKLPWFLPTTPHGQSFNSYLRLVMALLPHDVSYIHKVINHIFSSQGLFQCIMLGEHRQVLADLLWAKTVKLVNDFKNSDAEMIIAEDQMQKLNRYIYEIRTLEDIVSKAKLILKKNFQKVAKSETVEIEDFCEQMFMRVVFNFHPRKGLSEDPSYPIFVGKVKDHPTFFVQAKVNEENKMAGELVSISVKKCVAEVAQAYTLSMKDFYEQKYQTTALKRVAQLLAKLMELYPAIATSLVIPQLIEKIPHKNTSADIQYLYLRLIFDVARLSPHSEERIMEAVVDKLCQLDVDIKQTKARRQCKSFSSLSKIQPMDLFLNELSSHVPNEKETKMGLLFDSLLAYVKERIFTDSNKDDLSFIELLMKIFETKIFPLHKVNFMQYLPTYVIGLAHETQDAQIAQKCKSFSEKFLTFLVFKSLNNQGERVHLNVRQHAWNYLTSFLSRECNIIRPQTIVKCLQYVLKSFAAINKKARCSRSPSMHSQFSQTEASEPENQSHFAQASQEGIFLHSFIQGLTLVLVCKHQLLQREDPGVFTAICKLIFRKHFTQSMIFCRPIILGDLLRVTQQRTGNSGLSAFKTKVYELFKSQRHEMQSTKSLIYSKIAKFFPYDSPYYLSPKIDLIYDSIIYLDINAQSSTDSTLLEAQPCINIELNSSSSVEHIEDHDSDSSGFARRAVMINCEVDVTTSCPDEQGVQKQIHHSSKIDESIIEIDSQSKSSQQDSSNPSVLYKPHQFVNANQEESPDVQIISPQSSHQIKMIDLEPVIAMSRQTDAIYNINNTLSAEAHVQESQELFIQSRAANQLVAHASMLCETVLQELDNKTVSFQIAEDTEDSYEEEKHQKTVHFEQQKHTAADISEVASSSKDTEYSVNPGSRSGGIAKKMKDLVQEDLSEKQIKRRSMEKRRQNITKNLREENDRAGSMPVVPTRKSQRLNKVTA